MDNPDLPARYGACLIGPFAGLLVIIAVFKIIFRLVKPKSTLVQVKKGKNN